MERNLTAPRAADPGAFAFVMATGILSTALRDVRVLSAALLAVAAAGYLALLVATCLRPPRPVVARLAGERGFAFLAMTAASDVLAGRATAERWHPAAAVLLGAGALSWLVLAHGIPFAMITRRVRGGLTAVDGTWFLWVVGTQSVAVAAADLGAATGTAPLTALATACWGIGLLLYPLIAALVLARLLLHPADITPPYWVFMGAAAISVLAGAKLAQPQPVHLLPPGAVVTVCAALWSFGTWLIPLLIALTAWRHLRQGVPVRYQTALWSMVFPVGMHAVATTELGKATNAGWLITLGHAEAWPAATLWLIVFTAMLHTATRRSTPTPRHPPPDEEVDLAQKSA
ncbi:tellurite resistance/C4-dicarboxylate transporter family protein [Actinokineospora sp. NPDC004072]